MVAPVSPDTIRKSEVSLAMLIKTIRTIFSFITFMSRTLSPEKHQLVINYIVVLEKFANYDKLVGSSVLPRL